MRTPLALALASSTAIAGFAVGVAVDRSTVDESARTHPTAKETGLFALAYYDADDRAELGADFDRRIRARVLEVWNAERPGPPGSAL